MSSLDSSLLFGAVVLAGLTFYNKDKFEKDFELACNNGEGTELLSLFVDIKSYCSCSANVVGDELPLLKFTPLVSKFVEPKSESSTKEVLSHAAKKAEKFCKIQFNLK